jgi:hypothetical protein
VLVAVPGSTAMTADEVATNSYLQAHTRSTRRLFATRTLHDQGGLRRVSDSATNVPVCSLASCRWSSLLSWTSPPTSPSSRACPLQRRLLTIAFSASYVAGARPGKQHYASGSLIRRTRTLAFATAELAAKVERWRLASVTTTIRTSS